MPVFFTDDDINQTKYGKVKYAQNTGKNSNWFIFELKFKYYFFNLNNQQEKKLTHDLFVNEFNLF